MADGKYCVRVKLGKGCLCLAAITFLISSVMAALAVGSMVLHRTEPKVTHGLSLPWSKPVANVTLGLMLVMCVLWMLFSVLLFVGILKSKASCVMSYFLFGVGVSLMLLVTAVLLHLKGHWPLGLLTISCTMTYLRCLGSVYTAYERLRQGKLLDDDDERQLITDEDFQVDD